MGRYDDLVSKHPTLAAWQKADAGRLERLSETYLGVPADYLSFLAEVGFGKSDYPSFRLYAGLSPATDVYGEGNVDLREILLLGDDFQGFTTGFDGQWRIVQLEAGDGPVEVLFATFDEFIRDLFSA